MSENLRNIGNLLQQSPSRHQDETENYSRNNPDTHPINNGRRHLSETTGDLRDHSISGLEQRIEDELKQPVKKFGGVNSIRMCGRRSRCFMGHQPQALIFTGLMINIPATFFNAAIAPVPLWDDEENALLLVLCISLQILCTVLMIWTSVIDPGIVPATYISKQASDCIEKKYL